MSVRSAARLSPLVEARPVSATVPVDLARKRRSDARRRRLMVSGGRLVLGVVIVAGWEFGARAGVIDKFFWSQPSDIGATLWRWLDGCTVVGLRWELVV